MRFRAQLAVALRRVRRIVAGYFAAGGDGDEMRSAINEATDEERIAADYLAAAERLRPHVVDGQAMVDAALVAGERILLEGQLGTMRDIDWGTYPYVTSSSPIPGGASIGAGLPAVAIDQVIGVAKAYTTAVGAGPLPTELLDASGEALRERGVEYGTSTGRPRRCGWYDAVAVRFSVRLAGYSSIALTKLDVLDGFEQIRVCVAYRDPSDGREWTTVPASTSVYERLEPIYQDLPGWQADTTGCRAFDQLPRGGAGLRRAAGGAGRRADRAHLGWAGAGPDDRPRIGLTSPMRACDGERLLVGAALLGCVRLEHRAPGPRRAVVRGRRGPLRGADRLGGAADRRPSRSATGRFGVYLANQPLRRRLRRTARLPVAARRTGSARAACS